MRTHSYIIICIQKCTCNIVLPRIGWKKKKKWYRVLILLLLFVSVFRLLHFFFLFMFYSLATFSLKTWGLSVPTRHSRSTRLTLAVQVSWKKKKKSNNIYKYIDSNYNYLFFYYNYYIMLFITFSPHGNIIIQCTYYVYIVRYMRFVDYPLFFFF